MSHTMEDRPKLARREPRLLRRVRGWLWLIVFLLQGGPYAAAADLPVAPAPRPKADETRMPGYRSGKHANIVVIINETPQPGDKPRVNPLLQLQLNADGELSPGVLMVEDTDEWLKQIVANVFKGRDDQLVIAVEDPAETSLATLSAIVDRLSVATAAVDNKKVLTLLFYMRNK